MQHFDGLPARRLWVCGDDLQKGKKSCLDNGFISSSCILRKYTTTTNLLDVVTTTLIQQTARK
jgi:hypothetical protein